jgi:hypothetical protein
MRRPLPVARAGVAKSLVSFHLAVLRHVSISLLLRVTADTTATG